MASLIQVDSLTQNPDLVWMKLDRSIVKQKLDTLPLSTPIHPRKVRFVCISDTHSKIHQMTHPIPDGDILIHAGDFTKRGGLNEVEEFAKFLQTLDHKFKFKVVIAGNHELSFEPDPNRLNPYFAYSKQLDPTNRENPRKLLKNCIYLEENTVQLFGINIFGSPWTPRFGDWAFNADRGDEILDHWNLIPDNTDVLITHGPPLGIIDTQKNKVFSMFIKIFGTKGFGDRLINNHRCGCVELLNTVRHRVKPKYHIFGHIHEDFGSWTDGVTKFINASSCNLKMNPVNPPIIFDIDLPDNIDKDSYLLN